MLIFFNINVREKAGLHHLVYYVVIYKYAAIDGWTFPSKVKVAYTRDQNIKSGIFSTSIVIYL